MLAMMMTMMMMVMMMLEGQVFEHFLQILDVTAPEPRFWTGPDQLLLQDTIESGPPETRIWAIGDPSSLMIFICIIKVGDPWPADPPCRHQKWRNYEDCRDESILSEMPTSTWGSMMMMCRCSRGRVKRPLTASDFAESLVTVWQIDIGPLDI